jgi:hypothetical protein
MQIIQARRAGDLDKTLEAALAAMRADPTSAFIQKVYGSVIEDRHKQMLRLNTTLNFLNQAVDAANAGHDDQALALANQALASDPNPVIRKFVEELRKRPAKSEPAPQTTSQPQPPQPHGMPLWPIGAGAGLALVGYGIARSKGTWSDQDLEDRQPTAADEAQARENRYRFKVAAVSVAIGFGLVYGGPRLLRAAGSAIAALRSSGPVAVENEPPPTSLPTSLMPDSPTMRALDRAPSETRLTPEQITELNKNVERLLGRTLESAGDRGHAENVARAFQLPRFRFLDQVPGAVERVNKALAQYNMTPLPKHK